MTRFFLGLVTFFLTLTIGLSVGCLKLEGISDSGLPKKEIEPRQSPKHYDFFADAPEPDPKPLQTIPVRPLDRQQLSCTDRNILPIWKFLLKDQRIYETEDDAEGNFDCSQIVEAHYVDLNRDGNAEILVRGKTFLLCGGVGNCAFWIFQKTGSRYRVLLEASDYFDRAEMGEQLLKSRTNRYSDLLLKGHFSAAETGFYFFKFDGRKYRETKCLYEVRDYDSKNKIHWKFITCEQFYKRQSH